MGLLYILYILYIGCGVSMWDSGTTLGLGLGECYITTLRNGCLFDEWRQDGGGMAAAGVVWAGCGPGVGRARGHSGPRHSL